MSISRTFFTKEEAHGTVVAGQNIFDPGVVCQALILFPNPPFSLAVFLS